MKPTQIEFKIPSKINGIYQTSDGSTFSNPKHAEKSQVFLNLQAFMDDAFPAMPENQKFTLIIGLWRNREFLKKTFNLIKSGV